MSNNIQIKGAFSSFSVKDISAAKKFYSESLGLSVKENEMGILIVSIAGGTRVMIYPKADHQPAIFTVLNLEVNSVEDTVDALTGKGIRFEQYEGEMKTNEKGIFVSDGGFKFAWFRDPAGNFIALVEGNEQM